MALTHPVASRTRVTAGATDSSLHALLPQLKLSELRDIVEQRGWPIKGSSRGELAAALVPLLSDHTEVARAVVSLPHQLRLVLPAAMVAEDGNGITPAALAKVATALGVAGDDEVKPVEAAGYLNDLARWGLLIPWRSASNELRFLFPVEIQKRIPPLPGWCAGAVQNPSSEDSVGQTASFVELLLRVAECASHRALKMRPLPEPPADKRLQALLGDWTYEPEQIHEWVARVEARGDRGSQSFLVVPKPFLLDSAGLEAVAALTDGHLERAEFACRILLQLNIVASNTGHLVTRQRELAAFQDSPEAERQVVQAYFSLLDWSELDWLLRTDTDLRLQRSICFPFTYNQFRSQLLLLRNTLSRFVASANAKLWCSLTDADHALRTIWPSFFPVPPADNQDWPARAFGVEWHLLRRREHGLLPLEGQQDWQAGQGAFLRLLLQGPLSWLGLVDLASRGDYLLAFRQRGLSDLVWGRVDAGPPPGRYADLITLDQALGRLCVDPRLAPPEIHAFLGSIAQLEEATAVRYAYRMDMRKAYATFATTTLEELLTSWRSWMPAEIPPPVREELGDWWTRYGQVHLYDGLALLEAEDAVTMRELEATTSLSQHILARLSSQMLLVPHSAVEALLQEFLAKGYTPKEVR